MILVDTSVWIDFLEGHEHWTKNRLKQRLEERVSIAYIDMIILEILMGLKHQNEREELIRQFTPFVELPVKKSSLLLASEIYQYMQQKGIRIRSMVDCLISAIAIERGATIMHKDRDFDFISEFFPIITERK